MNGYKIVLLKAILCFIGCRKVNGYAPEYVCISTFPWALHQLEEGKLQSDSWDFTITFLNSRDEMLAHFLKNLLKEA